MRSQYIILSVCLILFSKNAFAYLDPGTGSMITQIIIGAVLGLSYAVKVYWRRIVNFFKKEKS